MGLAKELVVLWVVVAGLCIPAGIAGMTTQNLSGRAVETGIPIPSDQEMQDALAMVTSLLPTIEEIALQLFNQLLPICNKPAILFLPYIANYKGIHEDLYDEADEIVLRAEKMGYLVVALRDEDCTLVNYIAWQVAVIWLGAALQKPVVQVMQMHGNPLEIAVYDSYDGYQWHDILAFNIFELALIKVLISPTLLPPIYTLVADCCGFLGEGLYPTAFSIGFQYLGMGRSSIVCGWYGPGVCPGLKDAFYAMSPTKYGGSGQPVGTAWLESQPTPNCFGGIDLVIWLGLTDPFTYTLPYQ